MLENLVWIMLLAVTSMVMLILFLGAMALLLTVIKDLRNE